MVAEGKPIYIHMLRFSLFCFIHFELTKKYGKDPDSIFLQHLRGTVAQVDGALYLMR